MKKSFLFMVWVLAGTLSGLAQTNSWPGLRPDGSVLLPNQWSLQPAGTSLELGDFPVNLALSPDGKFAAILHCGYSQHEVVIVDLASRQITCRQPVTEAFYGLTFSRDGERLFCSGASTESIHQFSFRAGKLQPAKEPQLHPVAEAGVPCGLAVDAAGKTLYAANLWNSRVSWLDLKQGKSGDILLAPERLQGKLDNGEEDFDTAAATKRAKAAKLAGLEGPFPYACALAEKSQRLYVSLWAESSVAVIDLRSRQLLNRWSVGNHPAEMALRADQRYLYVANANDNTVSVLDTATGRVVETLWSALYPDSPRGSTPASLALSPDGTKLFVANANINAVSVFEVASPGHSRSLGFIPTGWYPTCVRVTPDGRTLLVLNGKGNHSQANPHGPQPVPGQTKKADREYIASLFKGTLSMIPLPEKAGFESGIAAWTTQVLHCSPLRPAAAVTGVQPAGNPIPSRPGETSPIRYCLYIIKENRTYDQVFGDIPEGNGAPELCLFPAAVTPNLHRLVKQFVLLDNCYADAEVSADGHEWSMAAYATDFVEKTWPLNYGHKKSKFPYPSEGVFSVAAPASGYLWDRAAAAGISYRSYGEFVQNASAKDQPATTKLKVLQGHFDPWFHGFDLDYPDAARADRFIAEWHRFETNGDLPRLQILRLPNDHTHGVTAGKLTPTAFVADNDAAVGRVVEAVSHSRFWPQTAIFIVEDDAQNGPDHVDAHRMETLVISPYTRHHAVDSTLYSTTSILRTMELILGLQPMTQFDAAAAPLFNAFQVVPELTPYVAVPAGVDLTATNTIAAWGQKRKFDFAREDANDDLQFNEVIWHAVRGTNAPMPAPVHAGFVLVRPGERDDD
ncbi:MAG TPA: beta-propeller fold lactonase family protein [Verrucomicrobiae bacterium]